MIWMTLIFVVILFSSISTIQSLMRFKLKTRCENKREITLVVNGIWIEKYVIKTIVTNLREACVNIILYKLEQYGVENVNNLNPIDLSLDHWLSQIVVYDSSYLKEYLQLFAEKSTIRRTLVIFSWLIQEDEVQMLYDLQMEKNVDVIVTGDSDIVNHKQVPIHRKILIYRHSSSTNLKRLVDIIKNPNYYIETI